MLTDTDDPLQALDSVRLDKVSISLSNFVRRAVVQGCAGSRAVPEEAGGGSDDNSLVRRRNIITGLNCREERWF